MRITRTMILRTRTTLPKSPTQVNELRREDAVVHADTARL
jgi:hypothetical protein